MKASSIDLCLTLPYTAHSLSREGQALGNLVNERKNTSVGSIGGSCLIPSRLDGSGFSQAVRLLSPKDLLMCKHGYSKRYTLVMQVCFKKLIEKFNAKIGVTQCGKMVVFIESIGVVVVSSSHIIEILESQTLPRLLRVLS